MIEVAKSEMDKPSLRSRLVRHVVVPLVLTWGLGTAITLGIANHFVGQAFDRSLLDDAYSVATHVGVQAGQPVLRLSQTDMATVLCDQSEQVYFAVLRPNGELLAGHAGLHAPPPVDPKTQGSAPAFFDLMYQGRTLRSVALYRDQPAPFVVVMAQTTTSRTRLLGHLLLYSLAPQSLVLGVLAWWLRRAIKRDLTPLTALQHAMQRRDARDLTPLAVQASTRDVQQLGDAVNALLGRVAQGVRAQCEFAGNVAHELRTPLAGIRALASYGLAQHDPQLWRQQLQDIVRSEERASHMVDQLLALALADEANAAMPMEILRLDTLAREAILRFLPRADALGVDLGAQGLEQPVLVQGHAALVEGILNNLLDNALRYGRGPEGGDNRVTVAVRPTDDGATVLSVTDNGPGMDATHANGLIERWAQGRAGQQLGHGAGLGLAIVAQYTRLMGARMELRPAEGGNGQAVHIYFGPRDNQEAGT
jgi:two-component system sensor histidine kinase TctE